MMQTADPHRAPMAPSHKIAARAGAQTITAPSRSGK
jgi:hypothetical protein